MAHARASSPDHGLLATGTCGLYFCEGLIVKSSARQHLSIRWRNTAHPAARNALLSRPDDPMLSFVAAGCMPLAHLLLSTKSIHIRLAQRGAPMIHRTRSPIRVSVRRPRHAQECRRRHSAGGANRDECDRFELR